MVKEGKMVMGKEVRFVDERLLPHQRLGQDVQKIQACLSQDLQKQVELRSDHELDGVLHRLKC